MIVIRYIVSFFFFFALVASVFWYLEKRELESLVSTITLLATIIGIFIEKWLSEYENKIRLLNSLYHEILINISIVNDVTSVRENVTKFKVILQFENNIVNQVVYSHLFLSKKDRLFYNLLIEYQLILLDFNKRLYYQDLMISANNDKENIIKWYESMIKSDIRTKTIVIIEKIEKILKENYKIKSNTTKR